MVSIDQFREITKKYGVADDSATARHYRSWSKTTTEDTTVAATAYIEANIPTKDQIAICDLIAGYTEVSYRRIVNTCKWAEKNGYTIIETLMGPYVSLDVVSAFKEYIEALVAVEPVFNEYCCEHSLSFSPVEYAAFKCFAKGHFQRITWHPIYDYKEYFFGDTSELGKLLVDWSTLHYAQSPSPLKGHQSVCEAAMHLNVSLERMHYWCQQNRGKCVFHQGKYYIADVVVSTLESFDKKILELDTIVDACLANLPKGKVQTVRKAVFEELKQNTPDWVLQKLSYPQQRKSALYVDKTYILHARRWLEGIIDNYEVFSYTVLQGPTGLRLQEIRDKIIAGVISAKECGNDLLISNAEYKRICFTAEMWTDLDSVISECVEATDSFFVIANARDRSNFVVFAEDNAWWDSEIQAADDFPLKGGKFGLLVLKDEVDELFSHVNSWIALYGKDYQCQLDILYEMHRNRLPKTVALLETYFTERKVKAEAKDKNWDAKGVVDGVNAFLSNLTVDLQNMTETDIVKQHSKILKYCTLSAKHLITDFINDSALISGKLKVKHSPGTLDTSAYSYNEFSTMIVGMVSEPEISRRNLIEKAVAEKRYADLWLYTMLHIFASWRSTDYLALDAPLLDMDAHELMEAVKNKEFTEGDATALAARFIAYNTGRRPNKTLKYSGVPDLYFFCPESCQSAFGFALAIAAAHYYISGAKTFVVKRTDILSIKGFYGNEFADACGGKPFSGRRANKALLQALSMQGDNPLTAYTIASIVRSHKLTYGEISHITDIYLKDGQFGSLSPDEISYQMFERGVCSFSVNYMLTQLYGEKYTMLPFTLKTEMIKGVGLSPAVADSSLRLIQRSMAAAGEIVKKAVESKEEMGGVLQSIIAGTGTGKDLVTLCLLRAANRPCAYRSRQSCLGCEFEVDTKTTLCRLITEANRLVQAQGKTEFELGRDAWLRSEVIMPKIRKISMFLRSASDKREFEIYRQLAKEVEAYEYEAG